MNWKILENVFWGNRILDYLISSIVLVVGFLTINIVIRRLIKRLKKVAGKTLSTIDDFFVNVLEKIGILIFFKSSKTD